MDKKTKTILTVGVLAAVGYLVWKQTQKKSFANLAAAPEMGPGDIVEECRNNRGTGATKRIGGIFGNTFHKCCGGAWANKKPDNIGCVAQQAS